MRRLNLIGFALNGMSGVALVLFFAYQRIFLSVAGAKYVTTLDRVGVFSEERLAEYDPHLAHNMRYSVGNFITQDHEQALSVALLIWAVVVVVNLAIFLCRAAALRSLKSTSVK
jgi:hypothetical protein